MPTVDEALSQQDTNISATLQAGYNTLSANQTLTFTRYRRVVLPLDGFVFWVRADILTPSAIPNTSPGNSFAPNQAPSIRTPATTLTAKGSLHHATDTRQNEDDNLGLNKVVFTTSEEIEDLNAIAPDEVYITEFDGFKIAFSSTKNFYQQAGIFHYMGEGIYPAMLSQVVDDPRVFNQRQVISNSLPIWLQIATLPPRIWQIPRQIFPLFPSFLVPDNLPPPYGAVHIDPAGTIGLQGAPRVTDRSTRHQLTQDRVRITLYGVRNDAALDFVNAVLEYSTTYDVLGLMNIPVVRDDKRTQSELSILAAKKVIDFDVNYYQTRANDIARQLILSAIVSYSVSETPSI